MSKATVVIEMLEKIGNNHEFKNVEKIAKDTLPKFDGSYQIETYKLADVPGGIKLIIRPKSNVDITKGLEQDIKSVTQKMGYFFDSTRDRSKKSISMNFINIK